MFQHCFLLACLIGGVNALYAQAISISATDTTVCNNETVWLTVDTQGISPLATYQWTGAAGTSYDYEDSSSANVIPPQMPGIYTYVVTVTDPVHGTLTDSIQIRNRGFYLSLPEDTLAGCTFSLLLQPQISGNSSPVNNFRWSHSPATTSSVTVTETGTYRVTATDNSGCYMFDSIHVLPKNDPAVSFSRCKLFDYSDYAEANTLTYTNISGRTAGWDWLWVVSSLSSVDTITNLPDTLVQVHDPNRSYTITLQADSADCTFKSNQQTIHISDIGQVSPATDLCPSPLGFISLTNGSNVLVYPTLTAGSFYIDNKSSGTIHHVAVYSVQGVLLQQAKPTAHEPVDISALAAGQYIVAVHTETEIAIKRIMKY